jgi:hypothetical protein
MLIDIAILTFLNELSVAYVLAFDIEDPHLCREVSPLRLQNDHFLVYARLCYFELKIFFKDSGVVNLRLFKKILDRRCCREAELFHLRFVKVIVLAFYIFFRRMESDLSLRKVFRRFLRLLKRFFIHV